MTRDADPPLTYADSGVSIEAGAAFVERIKPLAAATARAGVMGGLGGFAAAFDPRAAGYSDPVLLAATDGVGTKVKLAVASGVLRGVGVDLVAMCVNDLICQGAEPLFFLDYFAVGRLDAAAGAEVIAGVAEGCRRAGCALIGGETAEMPGVYHGGEFDLAGFAVGAAERGRTLPRADAPAADGDVVLGLASDGAHANGFSLIRRAAEAAGLGWDDPAPFAPGAPLGPALLAPTRIYVAPLLAALRDPALDGALVGAAHITGGGLPENLPRAFGPELCAEIDLDAWARPPLFAWLAEATRADDAELLATFNCGIGMALIARPEAAEALAARLTAAGETVRAIGRLRPRAAGEPGLATRGRLFP